MEKTDRLAVLVDADNAEAGIVDGLLAEAANYGAASVRRIYGDWTLPVSGDGNNKIIFVRDKRNK